MLPPALTSSVRTRSACARGRRRRAARRPARRRHGIGPRRVAVVVPRQPATPRGRRRRRSLSSSPRPSIRSSRASACSTPTVTRSRSAPSTSPPVPIECGHRFPTRSPMARYVVAWQAVSADSHRIRGSFTFSVGVPSAVTPGVVDGLFDGRLGQQHRRPPARHRTVRQLRRRRVCSSADWCSPSRSTPSLIGSRRVGVLLVGRAELAHRRHAVDDRRAGQPRSADRSCRGGRSPTPSRASGGSLGWW